MGDNKEDVKYDEEFITNSRDMKLFTCKWIPTKKEPRALIFICHGYAMECSITMKSTAIRFVKEGFAVYGIDFEGHGKSSGEVAYVENFDNIVNDCSQHFTNICEKEENKGKKRYLLGESMGGAVVLLLHKLKPEFWHGAILSAPMCRIGDDMKPNAALIMIMRAAVRLVPSWTINAGEDIIDKAFKEEKVRNEVKANEYCYKGKPKIKTCYELLRVSKDLQQTLQEIKFPFLVLHGGEDRVTEKAASQQLYELALSSDKTFKLYPGMWHGLLYGEPLENIEIVFKDIIGWLEERTTNGNSRIEKEQKVKNDEPSKSKQNEPVHGSSA